MKQQSIILAEYTKITIVNTLLVVCV